MAKGIDLFPKGPDGGYCLTDPGGHIPGDLIHDCLVDFVAVLIVIIEGSPGTACSGREVIHGETVRPEFLVEAYCRLEDFLLDNVVLGWGCCGTHDLGAK